MFDPSTVSAGLTSLKTAVDLASIVRQSGLSLEKAEFKLKTAELIEALADVKMQFANVQQMLIEAEQENRDLKAKLELKGKVRFERPFCWVEGESDPCCAQCFESSGKVIHLQLNWKGWRECTNCKNEFRSDLPESPQQVRKAREVEDTGAGSGPHGWMAK